MDANSLEAIKTAVEELSRKYSWTPECCADVAAAIYDARKAVEEMSYEEFREWLKGVCK